MKLGTLECLLLVFFLREPFTLRLKKYQECFLNGYHLKSQERKLLVPIRVFRKPRSYRPQQTMTHRTSSGEVSVYLRTQCEHTVEVRLPQHRKERKYRYVILYLTGISCLITILANELSSFDSCLSTDHSMSISLQLSIHRSAVMTGDHSKCTYSLSSLSLFFEWQIELGV